MGKIQRALISVSDKTGVVEFAQGLADLGTEIVSTGGTGRLLKEQGVATQPVASITGFPEILNGRVKTLHPGIFGGLLARRDKPEHLEQLRSQGLPTIDLAAVNLYPFEKTVSRPDVAFGQAIENIDIGGPSILRAAAKNFNDVAAVVDPGDYGPVLEELKTNGGGLSLETRFALARKVFLHTAAYDRAISGYLADVSLVDGQFAKQQEVFPRKIWIGLEKIQDLRYGENPHQRAAFYGEQGALNIGVAGAKQLQGKELSFNNLIDLEAAFSCAADFEAPVSVVIKHTNPCGVAIAQTLAEAYRKARETDPVSAFGSVLAFNRTVDKETAAEIISTFVEAVIAPDFAADAREVFRSKPNLRLLEVGNLSQARAKIGWDIKRVSGGLLIQDQDMVSLDWNRCRTVTKRQPTPEERQALEFAWKVVKHIKSNTIVFTTHDQTIGIGAGQMSRVDSTKLAVMKARQPLNGTVVASDAFFPFRDGVDTAAEAGVSAVIQPGGSVRDGEVIQAADEHGLAMVFTGIRHFRH